MIDGLFELVDFSQRFAGIVRTVRIGGRAACENDAEHSYQLGLIAWYLSEKLGLGLDRGKILEYATVHDLVEVYAGDTDPHLDSEEYKASKEEREKVALEKIRKDFSDFSSLYTSIHAYETHGDKESRLVYVVDKILPVVNTYLSKHSYYIDSKVSFEKWQGWLREKMKKVDAESLMGQEFLEEFIAFFGEHQELFAKI